jgi:hypothetical protein
MSIPFKKDPLEFRQRALFAANVFDLLPSDHPCFVYEDIFEQLDTSSVEDFSLFSKKKTCLLDSQAPILEDQLSCNWEFSDSLLVPCLISSVSDFGNLSCPQITGTTSKYEYRNAKSETISKCEFSKS